MSYMLGLLQDDGQFAATGNLYGVPENPYNFTRNQITTNQWVDLQFGHFPESEAAKYSRGRLALPEMLAQFEREANLTEE